MYMLNESCCEMSESIYRAVNSIEKVVLAHITGTHTGKWAWGLASFPGHSQILSHSRRENFLHGCEIKSGSGLGTMLPGGMANPENFECVRWAC